MSRVVICAEVYSENLGDQVIARSIEWILRKEGMEIDVRFLDLSGKINVNKNFNDCIEKKLTIIRTMLGILHRFGIYHRLKVLFIWYCVLRKKCRKQWLRIVESADFIIIGGGQLLMDNYLAFPLKINELMNIAKEMKKMVIFFSCGVGETWSCIGSYMLNKILANKNIVLITTRDYDSQKVLYKIIRRRKSCHVSFDPAIFSAEVFHKAADTQSRIIGLGIMNPRIMDRSLNEVKRMSMNEFRRLWENLSEMLVDNGWEVFIFTNGCCNDHSFAMSLFEGKRKRNITHLKRATDPETLVHQISRCKAIVAHRLHANIIAYSLGVPSVGLIWDRKVKSFGELTGRSNFFIEPDGMNIFTIKRKLDQAIEQGIDKKQLMDFKAKAEFDMKNFLTMSKKYDSTIYGNQIIV